MVWAWESNNQNKDNNHSEEQKEYKDKNDTELFDSVLADLDGENVNNNHIGDNNFDDVLDDLFDEDNQQEDEFDTILNELNETEVVKDTEETKQKRNKAPEDRVNYGYPQTREVKQDKPGKSNLIVHSIVDIELDDEDKIMQEKIEKLKLKSIANEISKEVMIGDYGMSVADYLESKRKPRKKKGKQKEKIAKKREKQIESLEKLKGKNIVYDEEIIILLK